MMKQLLCLLLFSFYIHSLTFAQNPQFGIKTGVNIADLDNEPLIEESKKERLVSSSFFHFGLYSNIPLSKRWNIRAELLYSVKGAQAEPEINPNIKPRETIQIRYLTLPILLNFKLNNIGLEIGGELSYKTSVKSNSSEFIEPEFAQSILFLSDFDYAPALGLNYNIERLNVGVRYLHGLKNQSGIIQLTDQSGALIRAEKFYKNRTLQIALGYALVR